MNAPTAHHARGVSDPGPRCRLDHEPVLIVSGCAGATRRYRCLHHAEQLFVRGIPVRVVAPWQHDIVDAGLGCGIVILHRVAWDATVQMLIDQTRDTGGISLFDIDDLVFEPESTAFHRGVVHLPPAEQALYHDGVRRYRRTLLACDGAIVPTAFLAERVRALGRPAWISRNCLDLELWERSRRAAGGGHVSAGERGSSGEPVVIGYASGSRTHDEDFGQAAGPAVRRIMEARPDVVLRLVGPLELGTGWEGVQDRIERVPAVDWRALPDRIAGFDINLAPLELDNPFCQAKSELKWLEAAACGVPTIASATEAFADAVDDGVDGLLVTDTASWAAALERLVGDRDERRAIGSAARTAIEGARTTVAQAEGFEATLRRARAALRPETQPPPPFSIVGLADAAGGDRGQPQGLPLHSGTGGDSGTGSRGHSGVGSGCRRGRPCACPERLATSCDPRPERPLSIQVLAPEPARGSGGHTTLARMLAGLSDAGHAVTLIIEPGPHMQDVSERAVEAFMRAHFPACGARIRFGAEIEPCDVAIATGWTTALRVAAAGCARTKLYFVQDYEPWFQPLSADALNAEATYGLGLGHITIGPWLAETLRRRFGARAVDIDFGVEHDIYFPAPERVHGGGGAEGAGGGRRGGAGGAGIRTAGGSTAEPRTSGGRLPSGWTPGSSPRVVFYSRGATPRRGVALGLEALARVKAARPEVEIVLYGGERADRVDFPHVDAGVLSRPELADLYRSATVGLALSYTNLSLVPLEMAACGLPHVAIDSESVRWYQQDGVTCHVVAPTAEGISIGILRLIDDPGLRAEIARNGVARVAGMSWERAADQFRRHVEAYAVDDVRAGRGLASTASLDDRQGAPLARVRAPALAAWHGDAPAGRLGLFAAEAVEASPRAAVAPTAGVATAPASRAAAGIDAPERFTAIGWDIECRAHGMRRVELRIEPDGGGRDAVFVLDVLEHASSPTAIASASVPSATVLDEAWTAFDLRPILDSGGRRLHLRLRVLSGPRAGGSSPATTATSTATDAATATAAATAAATPAATAAAAAAATAAATAAAATSTTTSSPTPASSSAPPPSAWLEVDAHGCPAYRIWCDETGDDNRVSHRESQGDHDGESGRDRPGDREASRDREPHGDRGVAGDRGHRPGGPEASSDREPHGDRGMAGDRGHPGELGDLAEPTQRAAASDLRVSDDPAVQEILHRRRRSLALRRLRLARLRRRRILAATARLWWRWTRPVPPGPLRPWRDDAPAHRKLLLGLAIYGPLPVAREALASVRHRLDGGRP